MVKRYSSNLSMKGTIYNAVSDGTGTILTTTTFAYVKPSRLLLQQKQDSKNGGTFRVASDGKTFSYDPPIDVSDRERSRARLSEPVKKIQMGRDKYGKQYFKSFFMLTVPDIYVAASNSLPDASPVHDIVLGAGVNVDGWLANVITVDSPVSETLDGVKVTLIHGKFRTKRTTYAGDTIRRPVIVPGTNGPLQPGSKTFESTDVPADYYFYIGEDGLLKRFKTEESYMVAERTVGLASIWDVIVDMNPDIPLKIFTSY